MSKKRIQFTAATVSCCEAIDWEIVQVTFDTEASDFDEENRATPSCWDGNAKNKIEANFEKDGKSARLKTSRMKLVESESESR